MKNVQKTIVLSTLLTLLPNTIHADDYIKFQVQSNDTDIITVSFIDGTNSPSIILRIGEYPDKPGKRLTLPNNDSSYNLPIKYDKDNDNYYISEYYFNQKIATALYKYLKSNGVNVILQDTQNKSEDLNRAGKIAKAKSPKIYLSIHTNSYSDKSSGYFFMTNSDEGSKAIASRLSLSIKDNKLIPRVDNRVNDGYIGELNERPGTYNILGEFGFFSNPDEAHNLSSDAYINYVAKNMGNELIKILETLN